MKNIRKKIKTAVTVIVYVSVGTIVKNIVDETTPKSTTRLQRAAIGIGGLALTGLITKHALGFTEETVDKAADKVQEMAENGDLK